LTRFLDLCQKCAIIIKNPPPSIPRFKRRKSSGRPAWRIPNDDAMCPLPGAQTCSVVDSFLGFLCLCDFDEDTGHDGAKRVLEYLMQVRRPLRANAEAPIGGPDATALLGVLYALWIKPVQNDLSQTTFMRRRSWKYEMQTPVPGLVWSGAGLSACLKQYQSWVVNPDKITRAEYAREPYSRKMRLNAVIKKSVRRHENGRSWIYGSKDLYIQSVEE